MAKKAAKDVAPAVKPKTTAKDVAPAARVKKPPKLTKKQLHEQQWSGDNIGTGTSAFMREMMSDMRTEYGDSNIAVAGEAGRIVIGVPLPSFAFEYLIQNTVFPLGRLILLLGTEGTCKSGLCFEMVRWFNRRADGVGFLLENETKYSPDWAMSIIGWDRPDVLGHVPTSSVNDWQEKMQYYINRAKKMMTGTKAEPGSGRIWPSLIILDSLMGKLAEETIGNIEKEGHATRHYAVEAAMITDFLKKLPTDIEEWPFSLVVVNHLKKSKDDRGFTVRGKAGGKHVGFQETLELELSRTGKGDFAMVATEDRPEINGKHLNLAVYKNALGIDTRDINVDIMWWDEEDPRTGEMRQHTSWDWFGSTVSLLIDEKKMSAVKQKRIRAIVDLNIVKKENSRARVWSKRLGIPESAPVEFSEAGRLIQKDKEVLRGLRREFGIKQRKSFRKGTDYLQQLDELRSQVEAEVAHTEREAQARMHRIAEATKADEAKEKAEYDTDPRGQRDEEEEEIAAPESHGKSEPGVLPGDGGERRKPVRRRNV